MQLATIDVRGRTPDYRTVLPRGAFDVEQAVAVVKPICDAVAERGQDALREFSERFDGVAPQELRVDPAEPTDDDD